MVTVGVIGLGTMGWRIAKVLREDGLLRGVYNRTPSKARAFAEEFKVKVYGNPAELARDVDVVLSIVSDDDAIRAVMLGDGGVLNGVKGGSLVIEMSTISPSIELAKLMTPSRPFGRGFTAGVLGVTPSLGVNGFVLGVVVRVGYRPTGSSEARE